MSLEIQRLGLTPSLETKVIAPARPEAKNQSGIALSPIAPLNPVVIKKLPEFDLTVATELEALNRAFRTDGPYHGYSRLAQSIQTAANLDWPKTKTTADTLKNSELQKLTYGILLRIANQAQALELIDELKNNTDPEIQLMIHATKVADKEALTVIPA